MKRSTRLGWWLAAFVTTQAGLAGAAPDLALGTASGGRGEVVTLPLTFTGTGGVAAVQFDVLYDASQIAAGVPTEGAALAGTDHELDSHVVAPGRLRIIVLSRTLQALPSGVIVNVQLTIEPSAGSGIEVVALNSIEPVDDTPVVVPATSAVDGSVTISAPACTPGDIYPDGVGDGLITLADVVLGDRKVRGVVAGNARDLLCGDVHPGATACERSAGMDNWCPTPDGVFLAGDAAVTRQVAVDASRLSCAACVAGGAPVAWTPADVTPRGAPDGDVDVSDVVLMLRLAAGLDQPGAEELLRADIAPVVLEQGTRVASGDDRVDVADVVAGLRVAVGLDVLRWRQRSLAFRIAGPQSSVAFLGAVSNWPAWASVAGEVVTCAGGGDATLDSAGDRIGVTCISDPAVVTGPVDLATVNYRGPAAVVPANLTLRSELVDASLATVVATVSIVGTVIPATRGNGRSSGASPSQGIVALSPFPRRLAFVLLSTLLAVSAAARQGDVNIDCRLDGVDVDQVVSESLGRAPASAVADVVPDGRVSLVDVQMIIRFTLGLAEPTRGPAISGFTPKSGRPGTTVTVTGCDFDDTAGLANHVRVGGVMATVKQASATSLQFNVPDAALAGALDLWTPAGGAVSATAFTPLALPPLSLNSVVPITGESWGGTLLTIRGAGFRPGVQVDIDGQATARPRFISPGEIQVRTPPHASETVGIIVRNRGGSPVSLPRVFTYTPSPAPAAQPSFIYTMVGNGFPGNDGEGFQARATSLYWPDQIEFDWEGRLVVIDWNNHRVRRVDIDGTLNTLVGWRHGDTFGPALETNLNHPTDVLFDDLGNMHLSAWHNFKIKALDHLTNNVVIWSGDDQGYVGDGQAIEVANYNLPVSIAWLPAGEMVIADSANQRLRVIDLNGAVRTIAGTGIAGYSGDGGPATAARIHLPRGEDQIPGGRLSVDRAGNIYLTDALNACIRRIDTSGIIRTIAGTGVPGYSGDGGPATLAQLNDPSGLAVAPDGTIFVADEVSHVVRRIDPDGFITTIAGIGVAGFSGDRGPAASAAFNKPNGLALDEWGNLYVCDKLNGRIRVITSEAVGAITIPADPVITPPTGGTPPTSGPRGTIDTYVGNGTNGFNGDGLGALNTLVYWPHQVAIEPWSQLVFFIDWNNHRIRKVEANGTVVTVTGTTDLGDDYGPALSNRFNHPSDIVFEPGTNDLIIDAWHNDKIKKLVFSSNTIVPYVGAARGFAGDGGPATAARLSVPCGIDFDALGRFWIGDQGNQVVRRVDLDGTIHTAVGTAGVAGYSGDGGPAENARLFTANVTVPDAGGRICFDAAQNLYIADTLNHVVRKVDRNGIITTFAGTGTAGYSGNDGPATAAAMYYPVDVVIGPDGDLYVAERENHVIRKVDTATGIISLVAGNHAGAFGGDGGPATAASLYRPSGINFNVAGDLFIADTANARIRVIWH